MRQSRKKEEWDMSHEQATLLVGVSEAARRLGIGRNRAYLWLKRGWLPGIWDGGRIRIPRAALDRVVERIMAGEWPETGTGSR